MILQTSYFIFYDLFIGLLLILILLRAYKNGLFAQVFGVLSFLFSFLCAYFFYSHFASKFTIIHSALFSEGLNQLAWFFLLLIGFKVFFTLLYFFYKKTKKKKKTPLSLLNHMGGLVLGLIEAYLFIQCFVFFCDLPFVENGTQYKEESLIVRGEEKMIEEVKRLWDVNDSSFITN